MKAIFLILSLMVLSLNVNAQDETTDESTSVEESTSEDTTTSTESESAEMDDSEDMAEDSSGATSFTAVTGSVDLTYTCTLNNDERVISVVVSPDGHSGVSYTKFGEEKTVAVARAGSDYTRTVADRIKSNLEAASFTCSDSGSSASAAEEPATEPAEDTSSDMEESSDDSTEDAE